MRVAIVTTLAVFVMMLFEMLLSRHNERLLRARGAVEPADDVYRTMSWAYPACFVAMGVEGALRGGAGWGAMIGGAVLFALSKALKFWAISALGPRWSFRVLVIEGEPLIDSGPYRYLRHPNYVAVAGELVGIALLLGAIVTGVLALLGFGFLMRRRVAIEERALGRR